MAWEKLPTNHTDAVFSGLRRYIQVDNGDGTVSFQDATVYDNKENSFFGAKEANIMNEELNRLHSVSLPITTSGTGSAYTVTLDPAPTSLYVGMMITIIPHVVSASTSATLNVNGLGAKQFRQRGYQTGSLYAPYTSSFLTANKPVPLIYDGTYWIMLDYSKPYWYDIQSRPSSFTPTSHASSGETYGKGTSSSYGHVKLSDSTTSTDDVSAGVAATPESVRKVGAMASAYTYTVADKTLNPPSRRAVAYAYANNGSESLDVIINKIQNVFNNTGGTIFLTQGRYYIKAPITLKPRVKLIGCGQGTIITRNFYDFPEGEEYSKMIVLADDCAVESVRLYFGSPGSIQIPEDSYFSYFSTASFSTPVKNVTLRDIARETLYSAGSVTNCEEFFTGALEDSLISNCSLKNASNGITLMESKNVTIENCDFESSGDTGIYAYKSDHITIRNNNCSNCETAGIYLNLCEMGGNLIDGNNVDGQKIESFSTYGGIVVASSNYTTISNNSCCNTKSQGILCDGSKYNQIIGNRCSNNEFYGIVVGNHCDIANNILVDNQYHIIASGYCTITGNLCVCTKEASSVCSIQIEGEQTCVVGNVVRINDGISMSARNTIYLDNNAKNCVVANNLVMGKDVTDSNTDTANKNMKVNNKYSGTQG